ncbi:MAG: HNH endonuclease [Caldilineaceae bacterium]
MPISATDREFVRQRAQYACEYCDIREADAGNELTIDHFQPRAQGGSDVVDNLVYSCMACNQYKHDYWPNSPEDPHLWNPRQQPFSQHFLQTNDGLLQPLSEIGTFSLQLLHLNRPPLVEYRQKRQQHQEDVQVLTQLQALVQIYEQLLEQQSQLITEQRALLDKQQTLLQRLIGE